MVLIPPPWLSVAVDGPLLPACRHRETLGRPIPGGTNVLPVEDEDPLEVAWSVVNTTFEEADQELEARVTE